MIKPKTRDELAAIDVELKEAVCDAIVNMVTQRVSGSDETGRYLYGKSPRRAVFSGQLLPRLSRANADETSDIKIAAIGIDFNIAQDADSLLTATPRFSVYVRVLPTWQEISTDKFGIEIEFKLDKHTKQEIDREIREQREERYRSEKLERPDWGEFTAEQKAEFFDRRKAVQNEIRKSVYGKHGIKLGEDEIASFDQEPRTSSQHDATLPPEAIEETAAAPMISRLVIGGRSMPTGAVSPASIPGKWKRLDLQLPALTWNGTLSGHELAQHCEQYSITLRSEVSRQLLEWLAGEGRLIAWRNRTVRPADATSETSWNDFILSVQQDPPDPQILPDFSGLSLKVERQRDFMDPSRVSIRVSLDNACAELPPNEYFIKCNAIFGTAITLAVPEADHRPVLLDRVEPSYRFRDYLSYPAIGLNCGVRVLGRSEGLLLLETTWAPRFNQPRIVARSIDVECRYGALANGADPSDLLVLTHEYRVWVDEQESSLKDKIVVGLSPEDADREKERFSQDLAGQRMEADHIERGIRILVESRTAALAVQGATGAEKARLKLLAAPWEAWLMTNESFARLYRDDQRRWRLFQLAFVLAHIPTFASRMDSYAHHFDVERDEHAASLLYFPTGGGKSEAFYGALVFAIFLDRLRGKDRGVTAMIRYPLRLLTLQQAQRLLGLVVQAEMVRRERAAGTWPIEIGFWVGSSNTPNRFSEMKPDLPDLRDFPDDTNLERGGRGDQRRAARYQDLMASYNKVSSCPCCKQATGLRKFRSQDVSSERAAIICFNSKCAWNIAHGGSEPLPFLLNDDTIYQRTPAIVLGTVDKLAMLGQSTSTITNILGMFGLARWIGPGGHLRNPRKTDELRAGPDDSAGVFPAYQDGRRVFVDPFPSLVIQDEAHLLEESLGTFSGLFDTLLEKTFRTIFDFAGTDLRASSYPDRDGRRLPRLPKIIAATATISDPDRQLKVLYQRKPLRFPYPGPDIYRSFFAEPVSPPPASHDRVALAKSLPPALSPEAAAPWMRLYVSLMTNDATHTVTTVGVLSAFHAIISGLWAGLGDPTNSSTVAQLRSAVTPDIGGSWRVAAIDRAVVEDRVDEIMALVDLHRIALAYVTNKKGGDQVIDALHSSVAEKHRAAGLSHTKFISRLISGGVDMQEIQDVMKIAEEHFPGPGYPDINETLRSIVATSAISHGVDVDRFNSMFFAGLPSDIAEYIQASSRVGRTHVGFVLLLPTPQSRRDRYVIETHDVFHRFLERMIAPPAVERWAETAIDRVQASYIQTWAMLKDAEAFQQLPPGRKHELQSYDSTTRLASLARRDVVAFSNELGAFMLDAMGAGGKSGSGFGSPHYREFYKGLTDRAAQDFGKSVRNLEVEFRLQTYWEEAATLRKPMTSLRDVDEAGVIVAADYDHGARGGRLTVDMGDVTKVMKAIRRQRGETAETDSDSSGEA